MENNEEKLKLIGLQIDGFRKLKAIDMQFKAQGLTEIKGKNKQGKTSDLDTIEWLIRGNKVLNKDVINPEAEKIEGKLQVGDYIIKRIRGKSDRLEVKKSDGTPIKGEVQNFLNTFINELTFNPRPFLDKTELEKYKFLLELFKDKIRELSLEVAGMEFNEIDKTLDKYENDN